MPRHQAAMPNSIQNKGFALVEVLIAMLVLLFVFLALMQTALVSIDANMTNVLRDEAVAIAETQMNQLRNASFDIVAAPAGTVLRNFRNIGSFPYTLSGTVSAAGPDAKQVTVTVEWDWKEKTKVNGNPYSHTISTILRR